MPVIFPQNQKGLIGGDSKGHYSMDNNITDSSSFGELTHKLASNGITLGMKFPIKCSNQHPFYLGDPHSFNDEGVMDLIGEGWESRRKKWENVLSNITEDAMLKILGNPKTGLFGNPIPYSNYFEGPIDL